MSTSTAAEQSAIPAHLRRLVLTGFMGAGKTTIGRLLAARLRWEFLDLDADIESSAGLTVPSIFSLYGEPHFRQLESTALASALSRSRIVLALGGGAPEVLANRLLLEQTRQTAIIFLDAPFHVLFDRCRSQSIQPAQPSLNPTPPGFNPTPSHVANPAQAISIQPAGVSTDPIRPLLADPVAAEARFLVRQPIYRRLAHLTLETAHMAPEKTVAAILTGLI